MTFDLDLDFVRAQFPAFSQDSLKDQAFFENAGGSYTCRQVIDRLTRFYMQRKVQPYSAYGASRLGGEEMDEARERLAAMMGAAPEDISFGPSTTQNVYVLAQAFGQMLGEGDAIIVTNQDHEANTGAWRRLAARGIDVREWRIDPETGHLPIETLINLLDEKVKLVCFPHCSNIVAEINPVKEICKIIKAAGAYSCIDGVGYAAHGFPNIPDLGADIYMFSAYKTYGPHQGIMYVNAALAEALPNQGHHFNGSILSKRFTPAGPDHAQIAACAGMVDYFDALYAHHIGGNAEALTRNDAVHGLMRRQEIKCLQPLLDYLSEKNSVRLLGPNIAEKRAPTVAMVLQSHGGETAAKLADKGIMCSGGSFYSQRVLEGQNANVDRGVLRLSFVHYTSEADVQRLIRELDAVI